MKVLDEIRVVNGRTYRITVFCRITFMVGKAPEYEWSMTTEEVK